MCFRFGRSALGRNLLGFSQRWTYRCLRCCSPEPTQPQWRPVSARTNQSSIKFEKPIFEKISFIINDFISIAQYIFEASTDFYRPGEVIAGKIGNSPH